MGEIRYRVGRLGGRVGKKPPVDESRMRKRVASTLARHPGSWQIRPRGRREWSSPRLEEGTSRRLLELVLDGRVGGAWQFRPVDLPTTFYVVRKIEVSPPVSPPSVGSEAIREIHVAYFSRFPDHESWGISNCRVIDGSTSFSQHAWDNAEDFSAGGVASEEAEAFLFANRNKLPIAELIGRRKVWSKARASEGFRPLSPRANQHLDHWHVSALPLQSGTPPCV